MNFGITFVPSGHRVQCPPDQSILAAGLDEGLNLPFSCRSGICRTCRGRLVDGTADIGDVHSAYLDAADRAAGFIHLCQARPTSDCTIEIVELSPESTWPVQSLPARVLSMRLLASDVMALQLGLPMNEPVRFHAGQYIDVATPEGLRRSYSIAVPPSTGGVRRIELHVRYMKGGRFTEYVFNRLKPRDLLDIVVPRGTFHLQNDDGKPMVLVCSGTGFAPIKAIVEDSLTRGLTVPMHLYWGGRQRPDLYFDALARGWAAAHPHIHYVPVLSDATPQCAWRGRTGFVHRAVLQDWPSLAAHQVYACGAPVMVDAARREFTTAGDLPAHQFFADSFVSEADRAAVAAPVPKEFA